MSSKSVHELVQAAASGDRAAFATLVREHARLVTGVAYSVCGDFALSEDVGQEAFIEAWKNLSTIREPHKFSSWLCTIARRRAIDAVRASRTNQNEVVSLDSLPAELHDPHQITAEAAMSQLQDNEALWSLLARLPETYREPMVLYYRSEESVRDVAVSLGENEATIRQRLKRGREMLRDEVQASLRELLTKTAPQSAFVALVMAALPATACAAGASTATLSAWQASSSTGAGKALATSAYAGAFLGALVGIGGGILGTWMSWKSCEYSSQQSFIIRQALLYLIGFAVFGILLAILVATRFQGWIANEWLYGTLLIGLLSTSQVLNLLWIVNGIRSYKRLGEEARQRGEPRREQVQRQLDAARQRSLVTQADGSVKYEAFRWEVGTWFGAFLGSQAWMVPFGIIALWQGSHQLAMLIALCWLLGVVSTVSLWRYRHWLDAYHGCQLMLSIIGGLTVASLTGIQLLSNAQTQQALRWSPWVWCILLIFPIVAFNLWRTKRNYHQWMTDLE